MKQKSPWCLTWCAVGSFLERRPLSYSRYRSGTCQSYSPSTGSPGSITLLKTFSVTLKRCVHDKARTGDSRPR
jgi:hypothetical protein